MQEASVDNKLEPSTGSDYARYLVDNPQEIVRTLRSLIKRRVLISAFFNEGSDMLLTAVLSVDPENNRLILDGSGNEAQNRRLAEAERVIFVAYPEKIKVQFASSEARRGMFEGRPAFQLPLPQELLYLQRREFYRLATPIANPLICRVPLENGQSGEMVLLDISAGGIGAQVERSPDFPIEIGSVFPGCTIELPGITTLEVSLRVQNISEMNLRNGQQAVRCGCQFIGMPAVMQATVQRYIVQLERERISRTAGR